MGPDYQIPVFWSIALVEGGDLSNPLCQLHPDCVLRQVKYLNNLIEQDHRFIKRRTGPGLFFSFETAQRTLAGYETMNMLRKGQMKGVEKGNILAQIKLINRLFGIAA
jgi:transposase-like protein